MLQDMDYKAAGVVENWGTALSLQQLALGFWV